MTEAGWTRTKPTVVGFYWWKRPGYEPTIAEVYGPPGGLLLWLPGEDTTREESVSVSGAYDDTEFLGPLSPTDRQQGQVEAFKQGIEKIREREKFYTEQEAISEGQMRMTRGLQRNESSGCIHELEKLAQQAQEGGGGCAWLTIATIM